MDKIMRENENYERYMAEIAANLRNENVYGADENNLFDMKERYRMVKSEAENLAKQR